MVCKYCPTYHFFHISVQVTQRFSSEELVSWNLLTRTNNDFQYISLRLTLVYGLGIFVRYCILMPLRCVKLTIWFGEKIPQGTLCQALVCLSIYLSIYVVIFILKDLFFCPQDNPGVHWSDLVGYWNICRRCSSQFEVRLKLTWMNPQPFLLETGLLLNSHLCFIHIE